MSRIKHQVIDLSLLKPGKAAVGVAEVAGEVFLHIPLTQVPLRVFQLAPKQKAEVWKDFCGG